MSQNGMRSELDRLRAAVGRIERPRGGAPTGDALPGGREAGRPVRLGQGDLPLDAILSGGLRRGALHEVVAADRRDDAAAAGFALALAGRCATAAPLVWIVEDFATVETGAPYRPGLAAHGIDPDRLILVRTRDGRATLWAIEEALRLRAPAVLAELWSAKHYGLVPSRRLLLAARAGRGTAILFHAGLSGRGGTLSSAAETRFSVAACPSPRAPSAGGRVPIPGPPSVAVRLLKLRLGGLCGEADRNAAHPLVWNPDRRCFDVHPHPVGLPAAAADRPAEAPRRAAVVALRRAG